MAAALVMAVQARASLYNLTFTQTGESDQYGNALPASVTDAVGQLNVVGGVAVGGTLDVISGPDMGNYILVTAPPTGSDGTFQWDNLVNTAGPFFSSNAGLLWSVSGIAGNSAEMNMWYNNVTQYSQPAGSYSLWGAPPAYNPEAFGDVTLTAVPEPTTMIAGALLLLPFGASTLRILRKNRTA